MGAYVIFGRTFQSYQLSIGVLSTVAAGIGYSILTKKAPTSPPINASSSEEEKFILNMRERPRLPNINRDVFDEVDVMKM